MCMGKPTIQTQILSLCLETLYVFRAAHKDTITKALEALPAITQGVCLNATLVEPPPLLLKLAILLLLLYRHPAHVRGMPVVLLIASLLTHAVFCTLSTCSGKLLFFSGAYDIFVCFAAQTCEVTKPQIADLKLDWDTSSLPTTNYNRSM